MADLPKFPNQPRVEPALRRLPAKNFQGFLRSKPSPVRPVFDQRIIDVRNLQDARLERDFFAAQPVRVAASVHPFMVMPDHRKDSPKRFQWRADFFSRDGMLPHDLGLFGVQPLRFEKNTVGNGHFPNVVSFAA